MAGFAVIGDSERVPVDIWREVHKKKLERKDSIAVKRFLGRPESIALLERLGATIRPARGELEKREQREVATSRSSSNYGPSARKLNRRASFEQAVCDPP